MADVTPNWRVEIQRLKSQIAQQKATIEAQKLSILEMDDRTARHNENIEAALRAIVTYEKQLESLIKTHGE